MWLVKVLVQDQMVPVPQTSVRSGRGQECLVYQATYCESGRKQRKRKRLVFYNIPQGQSNNQWPNNFASGLVTWRPMPLTSNATLKIKPWTQTLRYSALPTFKTAGWWCALIFLHFWVFSTDSEMHLGRVLTFWLDLIHLFQCLSLPQHSKSVETSGMITEDTILTLVHWSISSVCELASSQAYWVPLIAWCLWICCRLSWSIQKPRWEFPEARKAWSTRGLCNHLLLPAQPGYRAANGSCWSPHHQQLLVFWLGDFVLLRFRWRRKASSLNSFVSSSIFPSSIHSWIIP